MAATGWSAEMDKKLREMKKDPDAYFDRAWREARQESTGWPARRPRKLILRFKHSTS